MNKQAFMEGYLSNFFKLEKPKENIDDLPDQQRKNKVLLATWKAIHDATSRLNKGDYDIPMRSGLNRVKIDSKAVNENMLRDVGFVPSIIAVPEKNQKQWMTYRHPDTNLHLHEHDDGWYLHKDRFGALQILLKKALGKDLSAHAGAVATGGSHAILEGVPGWVEYLKNMFTNSPDFKEVGDMGKDKYKMSSNVVDLT